MMEKSKKLPPLLAMIYSRAAWDAPEFKAPSHNEQQLKRIAAIADDYAAANPSDPFAGPRKRLHLLRGIDDVKDGGD